MNSSFSSRYRIASCICRSALLFLATCASQVLARPAERWFHSGFEGGVHVETSPEDGRDRLSGGEAQPGSNWSSDLPAKRAEFVYIVASRPISDYARSTVVETSGADGRPSHALKMESLKWDSGNRSGLLNRNEFSLFNPPYHSAYARYNMRLEDEPANRYPSDDAQSWRMFFEIKEPNSGVPRIEASDNRRTGTNNYRISFYIRRGTNGRFYWHVRGESPQPVREVDWDIFNDEVPVPFGRWFTVEVAFNHSNATSGYAWLAIDGRQVALYRGRTQHAVSPLPLEFWSPFKLYASREILTNGPLYQLIDNVEFWSAPPPDATRIDETQANHSTFQPSIAGSTRASSPSPVLPSSSEEKRADPLPR